MEETTKRYLCIIGVVVLFALTSYFSYYFGYHNGRMEMAHIADAMYPIALYYNTSLVCDETGCGIGCGLGGTRCKEGKLVGGVWSG